MRSQKYENNEVNTSMTAKRMKKELTMKIISLCVIVVVLIFAIIAYLTTAWFASNKTVNANGMQINAKVNASLIISDDASQIETPELLSDANRTSIVADAQILIPARHKDGDDYPVLLEYNTNPKAVSPEKGEEKESKTLEFAPVPVYSDEDVKKYYFDYTVYIASVGEDLLIDSLKAEMAITPANDLEKPDYMNAASIDFYLEGEYCGTLNDVGKSWMNNGTEVSDIELVRNGELLVPYNKTQGKNPIEVTMRFYFDGGLEKEAGQTYVYSEGLVNRDYSLNVNFQARDKEI